MTFEKVRLVGILNITPDSFSDGGLYDSKEKALAWALQLERAGADFLDIGGESTRPGASQVTLEEELARVIPVISALRSRTALPLSIDTTKPAVARAALEAGADIVNDVDGLGAMHEMAGLVREFEAGLILMHRRGTPETMQQFANYEDVVSEVFEELDRSFSGVVRAGVPADQIVLDPGIGFAKNTEQNLQLLRHLKPFQAWGRPLLVGPSRKSFIGSLIDRPPAERDWGTAAAVALAVADGANLVRVHHVEAMRDVTRVAEAIMNEGAQTHVWA